MCSPSRPIAGLCVRRVVEVVPRRSGDGGGVGVPLEVQQLREGAVLQGGVVVRVAVVRYRLRHHRLIRKVI